MLNLLKRLFGFPTLSFAGEGAELFGGGPISVDLTNKGIFEMAKKQGNLPGGTPEPEGEGSKEGEGESGDASDKNKPSGEGNAPEPEGEGEGSGEGEGEGAGEGGSEGEFLYKEEGIKTPDDAVKALKEKERYIRELETKNKRMYDSLKPYIKEGESGDYELDVSKLADNVGRNQPEPLSDEKIKIANDNFWKSLEDDALGTLMKVFEMAQTRSMAPYAKDMHKRNQDKAVNDLHEQQYKQYGDYRNEVKSIIAKNPELAKMGEEGVKLAYGQVFENNIKEIAKQVFEDGKKAGKSEQVPEGTSVPEGAGGQNAGQEKKTWADKIRESIHAQSDTGIPFLS